MEVRTRIKRVIKFSREREEKRRLICSAIRQLRPIEFYYLGGFRTVEPFALGIVLTNREDNESMLCWQTGGFSDINETVGWKLYRVSDMEDIEFVNERFTGDRPGYEPENLEMAKVICCVAKVPRTARVVTPPPPPPIAPPPPPVEVAPRPIVRVISHNQLMERFRCAHPEDIAECQTMLWPEPLAHPFPDSSVRGHPGLRETIESPSSEFRPSGNWHGMPVTRPLSCLVGQAI